jgi:glutaredoxin
VARHTVTLIGRDGCHLCDDARAALEPVAAEFGIVVDIRDVTADRADWDRWSNWVPVVLLDGEEHSVFRVDVERLRADLAR